MTYEAAYAITAVILSVQIVANYIRFNRVSNAQSTCFILLVVDNCLTALSSVVKWVLITYTEPAPVWALELCSYVYFITHFLVILFMFMYLFSTIKIFREMATWMKMAVIIPSAFILLAILSNPFTQTIFHYSPSGEYHRSKGIIFVYLGFVYYMGLVLLVLTFYRRSFSVRRRNIVLIVLGLCSFATIVQLFIPEFKIETCMEAVCALILFVFIQNPSEQMDPELNVMSNAAFVERMKYGLVSRKRFDMLELLMPELNGFDRSAKQEKLTALLKDIVAFLTSLAGNVNIYRVDRDAFALEVISPHVGEVAAMIKKIQGRFEEPWEVGGEKVRQSVRILRISLPTEMHDVELMQGVMSRFAGCPHEIKTMTTSDFDLENIKRNRDISGALIRAMDRNNFEMRYTPVYSQVLERVVAAEVSLRFFDEELGYVYDDELFRFAQRSGHVMQLGELIFERTCSFIKEQELDKQGLSFLGVRLHPAMCLQYHVIERLKESIDRYEIDPKMICLMLSEYIVSTAGNDFKDSIARLQETGVRICLEDYGSGFTSITSIFEMPFMVLKINQSVIKAALGNEKARVTMDCTLTMARELNLMTMVEGIDDENYFEMIEDMACDLAKGNYFYEQLVEEEFLQVIHLKASKGGEEE